MSVLLITPPMLQLNAPYAATPRLTGWLRSRGVAVQQADLSLELALRLFSRRGVAAMARALPPRSAAPSVQAFRRRHARFGRLRELKALPHEPSRKNALIIGYVDNSVERGALEPRANS